MASRLGRLRHALSILQSAIGAGELAPIAITARLEQLIEEVQALLAELAKAPDTDMGLMRSEASAALAELLTPREREVVQAVLSHGTSALAAQALGMSLSTLGHHRSNVLRKFEANSFAQVASILASRAQG